MATSFSAAYTDILTDAMYVVDGTAIVPFLGGAPRVGVWRSKRIVLANYPSFGWLRVNGPMSDPVIVRIYGDGALWHTATLTMREPARLPAGRHRHWEIEIESDGIVTSVVLASTVEELK